MAEAKTYSISEADATARMARTAEANEESAADAVAEALGAARAGKAIEGTVVDAAAGMARGSKTIAWQSPATDDGGARHASMFAHCVQCAINPSMSEAL